MDNTSDVTSTLVTPHPHHWRIVEASGPASAGICAICGASRIFKNWLAETDFLTADERRLGPAA